MTKLIAFPYTGGKFSDLNFILPNLPECFHYVEPFGGSAAVIINRDPSPIETFNDLNGDVANFFKVLRDSKDELIEKITFTPYSKQEFVEAINPGPDRTPVERARKFYTLITQSFSAKIGTGISKGDWRFSKSRSYGNIAEGVSSYVARVPNLHLIAARLRCVQIENRNAIEVIRRCDGPDTLFYCDPPYCHESRNSKNLYKFEMTEDDHECLASALLDCSGKVAISGYNCDLFNDLYSHFRRINDVPKTVRNTCVRTESLWVNY